MTRSLLAVLICGVLSTAAFADSQKPPAPPPAPSAPRTPAGEDAPPPPPPPPTPDGRLRKLGPNVRVEVTFIDQRADGTLPPKTVTVTTGDGHWGRVRSSVNTMGYGASPLNVDARPEMQPDGRILLALNLEYGEKRVPEGKQVQPGQVIEATLNESLTIAINSGQKLTVTQSADPMSDRKVTVDVKATVLDK